MGEYMGSVSLTSRGLASHSHSSKMALSWLVKVSLVVAVVKAQEFQKEADKALNCPAREKAKEPLGGDCNEGQKVRDGQDVSLRLNVRVSTRDGRGKNIIDKPSYEFRVGKCRSLECGLEKVLTGACVDEKLLLMLGPQLAYGRRGNKSGTVGPNTSLVVETEVLRVRNKKPEDKNLVLGFLDKISSGNLGSFAG